MPAKAKTVTEMREVARVEDGVMTFTDERAPISLSNEGAQRVSIHYGGDREKTLTISLIKDKPEFTFNGIWTGKDMAVIKRHLSMAYYQHTRELRRANAATYKMEEAK